MTRRFGIFLGLAVVVWTAACVDLEEKLVGVLTTDYYATAAGVDAAVNATYSSLRNFWGQEQSEALTQMGTDTWTNGDQGGYKYINYYDAGLNASSYLFQQPWQSFYQGINTANAVLDRADSITGVDPAIKRSRIAEAHFVRGLYYFMLVQMYGGVDVSLTENKGVRTDATRQSEDSVYKVVIADFRYAVDSLPVTQAEYGRATKGAAQHFLAKVYLTRAYKTYGQGQADFAHAAALADSVINSGQYSLLPNFRDLFCGPIPAETPSDGTGYCPASGWTERNSEFIFSVQESWDEAQFDNNNGNGLHLWFLSFYDDLPGTTRNINDGRAWRRVRPTQWAVENIWFPDRWSGAPGASPVLDTRYDATFQSVWIAVRAGTGGTGTSGGPIAIGDTVRWDPPSDVSDAEKLNHPYRIINPSQYDEFRYPTLKKWQDNLRPNFNETDGGKDIPLARLGETYLIAAEAYLGAGNAALAADRINAVRRRAVNPALGNPGALDITAGDVTLDFVMDERERELSGELQRWFDLVRPGPAYFVARVRAHNPGAVNLQDYHALRPIPQSQIDLVSTPFPQNPGY
jgi:hypothetical protein